MVYKYMVYRWQLKAPVDLVNEVLKEYSGKSLWSEVKVEEWNGTVLVCSGELLNPMWMGAIENDLKKLDPNLKILYK